MIDYAQGAEGLQLLLFGGFGIIFGLTGLVFGWEERR